MKEFDPSAYRVTIAKEVMDGHEFFVGTVAEFPHVKVYETSGAEAYQAVTGALQDLYEQACELGRADSVPRPMERANEYSGRVTTRLPKWVHQRLDLQASYQGVSLNSHISSLLIEASALLEERQSQVAEPKAESKTEARYHGRVIKRRMKITGSAVMLELPDVLHVALNSDEALEANYPILEETVTKKVSYELH